MNDFDELASRFLDVRRSLPYVKFDKEITKKIKNEICILSYLKAHNGMAHPKNLSEEFLVSSARMSVILNQLESKEYVIRIGDQNDSRQTLVKILPKGNLFFEAENKKMIKFISVFFKEIGKSDANDFVRLYVKLMNFVGRAEADSK